MWVFAVCEFQAINMLICNLQNCVSFGSGFMHDGSLGRDATLISSFFPSSGGANSF